MYLTDASRFLISCVIQHYAPVVGWGGGQMHNVDYDPGPWRQTLRLSRQLIQLVAGASHLTAREGSNLPPPPKKKPAPTS
jgi:hypothetical protein